MCLILRQKMLKAQTRTVKMRNTSRADRSQRDLKKLLRKVNVAVEGSPDLDRELAKIFPSAPANVSRSIDALVKLIETELPGWWWTLGYCNLSNDASLYPPGSARFRHQFSHASMGVDGRSGPEAVALLELPKSGKLFDEGFHCDLLGGTVLLSMLRVFLRAKISLAKAGTPATMPRKGSD
jgi:hypothetical protein